MFPALHCFGPKKILAKTDSVHENARFFSLPDTNSVRQCLLKIDSFDFSHFWMTTLKTLFFIGFFGLFHFFFFCFYFSNIKKKKQKCNFLFENLIFDNPKFCKNTILTHCDTICVSKNVKNTIKLGKNSKKSLDQFLTYSLDQFLTYKRPNLGPIFGSPIYIYTYIHTYIQGVWLE